MSKITPELAKRALEVEAANVLKKLQANKTLSNSERELIRTIADGDSPSDSRGAWVKTKVELANALGVSRMTLDRWIKLKRNGPPKPESDGRWSVPEWKRWMKETGRGGGVDGDSLDEELPRLNAKRILLINERLQLDNAERRGELIDREAVVKEAAEIATTLRSALYGQAASICAEVMKVSDIDEGVRIYNAAIDRVLVGITAGLKSTRKRKRAADTAEEEAAAEVTEATNGPSG